MSDITEQIRILRAAKDGRLRTNEHGRYAIDGEPRPDRKARAKLMRERWIVPLYARPGAVRITEEGQAALRVLEHWDEAS